MIYFDERGISRHYRIEMGERTMTWKRDDPEFRQMMTFTAGSDGTSMEGKGRMAKDGGAWEDDLSLTYTREP